MQLTVIEKIDIAKLSQAYAITDIIKYGLYGGGCDLLLPRKIYCIRKNVEWLYNQSIQPLLTPSLNAAVISSSEIDLTWDTVLYATSYILQRALNSSFSVSLSTIYTGTVPAFSDTSLTPSTTYYYRVVAMATGYTNSAYGYTNKTTEAASFSPLDISDLWGWYDASVGVTGTTSVSAWADQSGNARDLTSVNTKEPKLTPAVLNSLSVLEPRTGVVAKMLGAENVPNGNMTIFIVGSQSIASSPLADTNGSFIYTDTDSTNILRNGSGNAIKSPSSGSLLSIAATNGTFYSIRYLVTGSTRSLSLNNGTPLTDTQTPPGDSNVLTVFDDGFGNYGNKQIAEIVFYSRALNGTEIGEVETYLNNKYNLY